MKRGDFLKVTTLSTIAATTGLASCKSKNKPDLHGFVNIFDGKDLSGWHTNRQRIAHGTGGLWQVENGVLTGQQDPPGSGNGGILMTDKKYDDFELLIDLAPDWGIDSGVFLRTNQRGQCFQIYVDYHNHGVIGFMDTESDGKFPRMVIHPFDIFGVFDDSGKLINLKTKPDPRKNAWGAGYLKYHCTPEQWKKAWQVGKWNTMRIKCVGKYPTISTWINGTKVAVFDGNTSAAANYNKKEMFNLLGRKGSIALQVHGGQGNWKKGKKCRWKNIRVKSL